MQEILLRDICDLDNGYAFKSSDYVDKSNTLNCRMSNIRPDGSFDILYNAKYLPDDYAGKYKDYLLNDGDLIIAMTDMAGDPKILGVPTVVNTQGFRLLLNQRVGKLRIIQEGVNPEYLKLSLQCSRVREYFKRFAGGGVQLNVSKKDILNAPIRMRSSGDQNHIAQIFNNVIRIKKLREAELKRLDELIKARFVEMFGDPVHNDKNWETNTVENLCKEIYGGGTPSKSHREYYDNGDIPWVSSKDMKSDVISDSQIHITQLGVDNSTAKLVPVNSVIMVTRSGILKHTLPVAINSVPVTVNQDLKVFIPEERILTRFLAIQFKMHEKDILSGVRAVTADNIEFNSLKQRQMIVPPIELQQRYVSALEQVDKSKVAVQKSLDEAQLLFNSLMQKYFG